MLLITLILTIGALIGGLIVGDMKAREALSGWATRRERELTEQVVEREKAVEVLELQVNKERNNTAVWKQAQTTRIEKAWAEVEQARRAVEEDRERLREAEARATALVKHVPQGGGKKAMSDWVRARYLQSQILAEHLTLVYIIDPSFNGLVHFRWSVQHERPSMPWVMVFRNGTLIRTEASLGAELGDIIDPGTPYVYTFRVYDGNRQLGHDLVVEMTIPTPATWGEAADPQEVEDERVQRIQAAFRSQAKVLRSLQNLKRTAYAEVEATDLSEDEKEWAKDRIDRLAAQFLGEA